MARDYLVSELYKAKYLPSQSFDSLLEFLCSEQNQGILYLLNDLFIYSKTEMEDESYVFVFYDDTDQISVVAPPRITIAPGVVFGTFLLRNYRNGVWSDIAQARKEDRVDIALTIIDGVYMLHDLKNKSLEEKIQA